MAIDYVALRTELLTDPAALGYGTFTQQTVPTAQGPKTFYTGAKSDVELRDLLNAPRTNLTAWGDGKVSTFKRLDIGSSEVLEAVAPADFAATISAAQCSHYESLTQQTRLRLVNDDDSDTRILTALLNMFTAATGTRTRLRALATRAGTRAEALFGRETVLTDKDIAVALGRD